MKYSAMEGKSNLYWQSVNTILLTILLAKLLIVDCKTLPAEDGSSYLLTLSISPQILRQESVPISHNFPANSDMYKIPNIALLEFSPEKSK